MVNIFKDFAPLYWFAGLQAIPLRSGNKMPDIKQWDRWSRERINDDVKANWLENFPDGNIGVCPGALSNVCFVDIDIWDKELLAKVEAVLPKSPWRRVGAKGCVLAYKWCDTKSFKVVESEDSFNRRVEKDPLAKKVGVEFFCSTGQVVMPPSIHPDTRQPYVSNCNLWDVVGDLQPIDGATLERKLREVLKLSDVRPEIRGLSRLGDKVSKGSRDNTMIKLAGHLAYCVRRGDLTLKQGLDNMEGWANGLVENVDGDPIDTLKGKQRIVEFLVKDVHERNVTLPKGWDTGLDEETHQLLGLDAISEDSVSLDFSDIRKFFIERMTEIEVEGGERQPKDMAAVDKVLWYIAKSQSISELEIDTLFALMQQHIGKDVIRTGALRKGLKKYQQSDFAGESHGQIAEEVLKDFQEIELRFDRGKLWEWAGSHWVKKDEDELLAHIIKTYGNLPAAKRASDHSGIYKTVCRMVAKPIKTARGYGMNFTNGYLGADLRLTPHDREYGLTYELPYEYHGELGEPKKFIGFLQQAWPDDPDMISLVQEALAVTLFGMAPRYQRCFLAYGVPHSGKSTLMEIVEALFPPQARTAIPPNKWSEKFVVTNLDGPMLNLAGELPDKKQIDSQAFKQIVNGEPITGEVKFGNPFTFNPSPAHWFASNHLPKTEDVSGAFIRRWMILAFNRIVPESERNIHLAEDIVVEEREAIVAWAVQAIERVMTRGHLIIPKTCAAMSAELGAQLNPIRNWFRDKCGFDPKNEIREEVAYGSYMSYALFKNYRRLDRGLFRATMREEAGTGLFECFNDVEGNQVYRGLKLSKLA